MPHLESKVNKFISTIESDELMIEGTDPDEIYFLIVGPVRYEYFRR